ncbi:MAG: extensin family protein [Myxococcota bacterium]
MLRRRPGEVRARPHGPLVLVLAACALVWAGARAGAQSFWEDPHFRSLGWPPTPYKLDGIPRFLTENQDLICAGPELVLYHGRTIRFRNPVRVHSSFVPRVAAFEEVVRDVGVEIYGRAPRRIVHHGAFNCRRVRGARRRVSEHALGNAIDLTGFAFGPLREGEAPPEGMPEFFRRSFSINVKDHWQPRYRRDTRHGIFLHTLITRLAERPEIFRGIVGPPQRRHTAHIHLDAAPWRYTWFHYEALETGGLRSPELAPSPLAGH